MFTTIGSYVALVALLVAVAGWWRGREPLRHEVLILGGILLYFAVGTIDIHVTPYEVSPRFVVPRFVWTVVGCGTAAYLAGAWLARQTSTWWGAIGATDAGSELAVLWRARVVRWIGWVGLVVLIVVSRVPAISGVDREHQSGYLTALAMLSIPGLLVPCATANGRLRRRDFVALGGTGLLLLATGYRSYTLLLALPVCVVAYLALRSVRARLAAFAVAGGLVLGLGIGFGYWRTVRHADPNELRFVRAVAGDSGGSFRLATAYVFLSVFREGPSILGYVVDHHPRPVPFTRGRALWGMLTSPLPGEQPDARAIVAQEVLGSQQTSLVSSIFGPWYLDFGIPGVIAGMVLLAFALGRVERSALVGRAPPAVAGYAYGIVLYALAIHAGLSDFDLVVLIPLAFLWIAGVRPRWLTSPSGWVKEARP